MSNDLIYRQEPPLNEYRPPGHNWGTALVVTCLGLGFVMSWAMYEMRHRVADEVNMAGYRHDLDALSAQQADMGRLLADPRTKVVRLAPSNPGSPIRSATVAWNEERQSGVVFCDDLLGEGRRWYQVWLIPASGDPTAMGFGPTEPGKAVYPISAVSAAAAPIQILLTRWRKEGSSGATMEASGSLASGTVQ